MRSAPTAAVELGSIRCPSGAMLLLDGGLAWMWSHDRPPLLPEWHEVADVANTAVELHVIGRDARDAELAFDRSPHPLHLFDLPSHAVADTKESFRTAAVARGLDATLEVLPDRIPHRDRAQLVLDEGGLGIAQFHGLWAAVVGGLPRDASMRVLAEPMPPGPDEGRWRRVSIDVREPRGPIHSRLVGHVLVDMARLMAVDLEAVGAWNDHDPIDGKADVVFWGADAERLARKFDLAPVALAGEQNVFGALDLPLEDALVLGERIEEAKRKHRIAFDFRPHTQHWRVMRDVRASPAESGTLELAGSRMCMFMTRWGDGAFPVEVDLDDAGQIVRIRIELGCDAIVRRQGQLEGRSS